MKKPDQKKVTNKSTTDTRNTRSATKKNVGTKKNSNQKTREKNTKTRRNAKKRRSVNRQQVENSSPQLYEVELILKKQRRKEEIKYLIKWKGWPTEWNTWEPAWSIRGVYGEMVEEFEAKARKRLARRRGRARIRSRRARSNFSKDVQPGCNPPESSFPLSSRVKNEDRSERQEDSFKPSLSSFPANDDCVDQYEDSFIKGKSEERTVEKKVRRQECYLLESTSNSVENSYYYQQDLANQTYEIESETSVKMELDDEDVDSDEGKVESIIGASEQNGELKFLIKLKNQKKCLVPNEVARRWIPNLLIKFYVRNTKWLDNRDSIPLFS